MTRKKTACAACAGTGRVGVEGRNEGDIPCDACAGTGKTKGAPPSSGSGGVDFETGPGASAQPGGGTGGGIDLATLPDRGVAARVEEDGSIGHVAEIEEPIVSLSPEQVRPRMGNPRLTKGDVEALAASIRAAGQIVPIVVRPRPDDPGTSLYEVVAGHRRLEACRNLRILVRAVVRELDDREAATVALVENELREAPDPLLVAQRIAGLRREGYTLERIGGAFGRSVAWVHARLALAELPQHVADVLRPKNWPVKWLEAVARLVPEQQEALLADLERVTDYGDLQALVAERLRVLGAAPWGLEDVELLPVAGSCVACPKQSQAVPGLFADEDGSEDARPAKIAKAVCRDAGCWRQKLGAYLEREIAARSEGSKVSAIVLGNGAAADLAALPPLKGARKSWEYRPAKRTTPGAVQALEVGKNGRVSQTWVVLATGSDEAEAPPQREQTEAEKRAAALAKVEARRAARTLEILRGRLADVSPKFEGKAAAGIVALAAGFLGLVEGDADDFGSEIGTVRAVRDGKTPAARPLWPALQSTLADLLVPGRKGAEALARLLEEFPAVFGDVTLAACRAAAEQEIRLPKWAQPKDKARAAEIAEEARSKPKPKKKTGRSSKGPRKRSAASRRPRARK